MFFYINNEQETYCQVQRRVCRSKTTMAHHFGPNNIQQLSTASNIMCKKKLEYVTLHHQHEQRWS